MSSVPHFSFVASGTATAAFYTSVTLDVATAENSASVGVVATGVVAGVVSGREFKDVSVGGVTGLTEASIDRSVVLVAVTAAIAAVAFSATAFAAAVGTAAAVIVGGGSMSSFML